MSICSFHPPSVPGEPATRAAITTFIAPVLLLLATFIAAQSIYLFPRATVLRAEMSAPSLPRTGMYGVERFPNTDQHYQWTKGKATITLPNAGNAPLVALTLAGGPERAVSVQIRQQGKEQARSFEVMPDPRIYALLLHPTPAERITLQIESPTMEAQETREVRNIDTAGHNGGRQPMGPVQSRRFVRGLGVVVSDITVQGGGRLPLEVGLTGALGVLLLYGVLRYLHISPLVAAGLAFVLHGGLLVILVLWCWHTATVVPVLRNSALIYLIMGGAGIVWRHEQAAYASVRWLVSPLALIWKVRLVRGTVPVVAGTLTLLPIANIVIILMTTGANVPSGDDFIIMIRSFLLPMLNGTYTGHTFFRDGFYNAHVTYGPALLYVPTAYFTHLNIYALLWVGMGVAGSTLALLYDALTQPMKQHSERVLLLPVLAALLFSLSQIGIFEHPIPSLSIGLTQFGFVLGLWGMARWPGQWRGLWVMVAGGMISAWSFATGAVAWPVFLVGMWLFHYRRKAPYVVWLISSTIAALPYLINLFFYSHASSDKTLKSFDLWRALRLLAMPFSNQVTPSEASGAPGCLLALVGVGVFVWYRKRPALSAAAAPSLMLLAYSVLGAVQVSLFRSVFVSWYNFLGILFWVGVVGLCVVLWNVPSRAGARLFVTLWGIGTIGMIGWLYVSTNLSHDQYHLKSFFLELRSPSSASCVRNYQVAPTFCVDKVVPTPTYYADQFLPAIYRQLEHHHLSPFGAHQRWMLQGDFVLDRVRIEETSGTPDIRWSVDRSTTPTSWSDYRHLNLVVHTPNAVEWSITLPKNVERAELHTAIAISTSVPEDASAQGADGTTFEISVHLDDGKEAREENAAAHEILFSQHLAANHHEWLPVHIPLGRYIGQSITLRFTSHGGENLTHDWALYQFPYIDVQVDVDQPAAPLHPERTTPPTTTHDMVFDVTDMRHWSSEYMDLITVTHGISSTWLLGPDPQLHYEKPLNVLLEDYSHIVVRAGRSSRAVPPQGIHLWLSTNYGNQSIAPFVLYAGKEMHTYSYDLKLLEFEQNERLTGLKLSFTMPLRASTEGSEVTLTDLRLIHR